MWVLNDSFNKWFFITIRVTNLAQEYWAWRCKTSLFFSSMLKSHPSWDGPLPSLKPLLGLNSLPSLFCPICFTQLMKGLGSRLEFWIWAGVFLSLLCLGVLLVLDVDPLFVFFLLVSWHCLSFGRWSSLCVPPFRLWALSHLWILVLSLYSLLLFLGIVLAFRCWSSLCVPCLCF